MEYPKNKRWESPDYLNYIREQPCLIPSCNCQAEPHHYITRGAGGGDEYAMPLCREHHTAIGNMGRDTFFKGYGLDPYQELFILVSGYLKQEEL